MMRERAVRAAAFRRGTRTIAAFVVAAALLLQLVLAAPLAMRMVMGAGAAGELVAPCSVRSADNAANSGRAPALPVAPHDHFNCPICQSHGIPLGILVSALLLFVATANWRCWPRAPVAAAAPVQPFRLYGSRAPPAFA